MIVLFIDCFMEEHTLLMPSNKQMTIIGYIVGSNKDQMVAFNSMFTSGTQKSLHHERGPSLRHIDETPAEPRME